MHDTKTVSSESFENLRQIILDLDDISYKLLDHPQINPILLVIEKLENWLCKERGHDFIFDQCGYWQHQYCVDCKESKYPDMAVKSCGDLTKEMGKMTEEEYYASLSK